MLREISVLQSPIPPDGCTTLLDEIERLRRNCRQMAQEVEEACPSTGKLDLFISHPNDFSSAIWQPFRFSPIRRIHLFL